jgi:phosphomannomutase
MKFGTDGVRGLAHDELTLAFATRLARAVARAFGTTTVVIGRDTRESGSAFASALALGFGAENVTVLDLGVAPTPAVAYVCESLDIAGVVISASHNPWHDNGLKVFAPGGEKLTDKQQAAVEALLEEHATEQTDDASLTTVGYGDVTPITAAGKFIAVASAVLGVVVVALITGIIASSFNAQMERRKIIFEDQVRKALLDGILDNSEKEDLEELRKRFGMSKRRADALVEQVKNVRQ